MSLKKPSSIITIVALLFVCIGLVSTAYIVRSKYLTNLHALDAASEVKKSIIIDPGTTAKGVALKLEREGIIREDWAFEWYMRTNDLKDKIQAGTYRLGPGLSVSQIAEMLTEGKVETKLVRILPAKRIDQIKQLLLDEGYSEQEVAHALDPAIYTGHPILVDLPKGSSLEGYIYPDSYQKNAETKAEALIKSALDQMQKRLTPEMRARFSKQGLTLHQAITFASIVEQEVSNVDDKPIVAQVFLKRYRIGMELGSDVTAFYASAADGKPEIEDVGYDSPYNTRKYKGLPPGPIGNTGESSLRSVAFPASTDFLYFVAGDDQKTHFSSTLSEHERLTRQYCTKLCGR